MSDEFKLEDEEAHTVEVEESVDEDSATIAIETEELGLTDEEAGTEEITGDGTEEITEEGDEEPTEAMDEEEDENVERRVIVVTEGPAIGAFTGMLMVSAAAYLAALALVLYRLSEYSAAGAFPW